VTVWDLLRALAGYVMRGRGRQLVYVWLDARLPEDVQHQFNEWNLAVVDTYAPSLRRDRFVMMLVKPEGVAAVRRWPWPPAAYASGDQEWVTYLHQAYYLLGMLWAVGASEQAILGLAEVAKQVSPQETAAGPG
jgi:hypothetical protein